ncbi:MAG: hypothetical protein RIB45_14555 [Marivibrio sp.]|uniref:alpha/beta hydrolase family esterase n=1 Tax=Marivibrio sp. TaxID=2039719 RepID=UPI0032EC6578
MRLAGALLAAAFIAFAVPPSAAACGPQSDCVVGDRAYRIALPDRPAPALGAIVHAHGYKGTAAGAMRNRSLRDAAAALGVALIALQARGDAWSLPNGPGALRAGRPADLDGEIAYMEAVLQDAAKRFGVDRGRVMATGFSAGGMLIWELACRRSDLAAGFAPISGTFWAPVPASCPAPPASLVHIHGTSDDVVPLDGRAIGPARQGRVPEALALYRRHGGFAPVEGRTVDGLECARSVGPEGRLLAFCRHDGGHRFDGALVSVAWRLLREAGAIPAAK